MISIIIPVYNAEQYVERGVACVLSQTFHDFEIITIDDGSTDRTGEILDALSQTDHRLKVVHKCNEGVGMARNAGLRKARGRYIYFMDIDDVLADDFLEVANGLISRYHEPDLLMFGFKVHDNGVTDIVQISDQYISSKYELSKCYTFEMFKIKYGSGFLWNKIFKLEVIQDSDIRFLALPVMEDELFVIDYLKHTNTVCLCRNAFYTYFLNNAGNSRSKYVPNLLGILEKVYNAFLTLHSSLNINDEEFICHLNDRTFVALLNWVRYYEFHKNNPLGKDEKRCQLQKLRDSLMWQEVFAYECRKKQTLENRLISDAINRASLMRLGFITFMFSRIRCFINALK